MKITERIGQSAIRIGSGARLMLLCLALALGGWVFDVTWIIKVGLALFVFFTANTAIEYWNVRRLRKRGERSGPKR